MAAGVWICWGLRRIFPFTGSSVGMAGGCSPFLILLLSVTMDGVVSVVFAYLMLSPYRVYSSAVVLFAVAIYILCVDYFEIEYLHSIL